MEFYFGKEEEELRFFLKKKSSLKSSKDCRFELVYMKWLLKTDLWMHINLSYFFI